MRRDPVILSKSRSTRSFVQLFEKMEGTTLPEYRLGWGHAAE